MELPNIVKCKYCNYWVKKYLTKKKRHGEEEVIRGSYASYDMVIEHTIREHNDIPKVREYLDYTVREYEWK